MEPRGLDLPGASGEHRLGHREQGRAVAYDLHPRPRLDAPRGAT